MVCAPHTQPDCRDLESRNNSKRFRSIKQQTSAPAPIDRRQASFSPFTSYPVHHPSHLHERANWAIAFIPGFGGPGSEQTVRAACFSRFFFLPPPSPLSTLLSFPPSFLFSSFLLLLQNASHTDVYPVWAQLPRPTMHNTIFSCELSNSSGPPESSAAKNLSCMCGVFADC